MWTSSSLKHPTQRQVSIGITSSNTKFAPPELCYSTMTKVACTTTFDLYMTEQSHQLRNFGAETKYMSKWGALPNDAVERTKTSSSRNTHCRSTDSTISTNRTLPKQEIHSVIGRQTSGVQLTHKSTVHQPRLNFPQELKLCSIPDTTHTDLLTTYSR
jgi:hypothetical protein